MAELDFGDHVEFGPAGKIKLKDMYIGSVDTTDEIRIKGQKSADAFYESYFIPDYVSLELFLNGEMLFAYGYKGTGKTALLRYIEQHVKRDRLTNHGCEFFPFRKEFPKEIYADLREAYFKAATQGTSKPKIDLKANRDFDYEEVWEYIFLRQIAQVIRVDKECKYVEGGEEKKQFLAHIDAAEQSAVQKTAMKFLPNISKGQLTISANPSLKLNFDFDDKDTKQVSFGKYIARIKELFSQLKTTNKKYYMLIDELDPRVGSGELFHLDLILIRDLIVAVKGLNAIFPIERRTFIFIAAIRTEVLHRVASLGKEIHKSLEQFGVSMNWGDRSANIDHPLIKMIVRKILYSEKRSGIISNYDTESERYIWSRYFKRSKTEAIEVKHILDYTWMRPRDIVRILLLCQKDYPEAYSFTEEQIFKRNMRQYSNASWAEIAAQLASNFDQTEITAIEKILIGFSRDFTYAEFQKRFENQSLLYPQVQYLGNKTAAEILSLLYLHGVIGNTGTNGYRFMHRGDSELQLDLPFRVHMALWSRFSLLGNKRIRYVAPPSHEDPLVEAANKLLMASKRPGAKKTLPKRTAKPIVGRPRGR